MMDFGEMLYFSVLVVVCVFGAIYVAFMGTIFVLIIVEIMWSWLRLLVYSRVRMLGSSTRLQLRSVLDRVLGNLFGGEYDSGDPKQDRRISVIEGGKFSATVGAYKHVFFWRVSDDETIDLAGISNLSARSSKTSESAAVKSTVLIIVDNAVHLSDRRLSYLTKALSTVTSLERIDLMLPYGQDPASFLEGGFPPPCFRCSAEKASRAFSGERDDAEDTCTVDSYHIEHAGSVVTAKIVYKKEYYGTKFVGVLLDRSCCTSRPTLQNVDEPRSRRNTTPTLDVLNFLPRVDVDSCALVSKGWRAAIERHSKSLTLHPMAQFTIYKNGSSRCAYTLAGGRLAFRASATVMLDAMRNSHVEHLNVEYAADTFLVDVPAFIADSNVTSKKATLTLPTLLSTHGVKTTHASPTVICKMVKHLKSEELALTFDQGWNEHLPSFELGRLLFSKRSANVHLTLTTPPSAHFLATFLDDFLQQCVFGNLHQMAIVQVAVEKDTVYDAPSLKFVKEFDLSDDRPHQQLARGFHLHAMQCRVYELHRQEDDTYTVIVSREPESPPTGGNRALQVVVIPLKLTLPDM